MRMAMTLYHLELIDGFLKTSLLSMIITMSGGDALLGKKLTMENYLLN